MSAPLFPPRAIIGMVHLSALPGTPRHRLPLSQIVDSAVAEANMLDAAGFDAVLIENMNDLPYLRREVGPEIVAAMSRIASAVCSAVKCKVGVQILAGANAASLAVAHSAGAHFIRAEGFVFASIADEGLIADADAGPLLRYRKALGAEEIRIFTDIKKKHTAHALTADVSLAETAEAAEMFGSDGVIVTGSTTGRPASLDDLAAAKAAVDLPVLVGSGATADSLPELFRHADAVIVGSWIKKDGHWSAPIDAERVKRFVGRRS
jgi:uncharacterized protein